MTSPSGQDLFRLAILRLLYLSDTPFRAFNRTELRRELVPTSLLTPLSPGQVQALPGCLSPPQVRLIYLDERILLQKEYTALLRLWESLGELVRHPALEGPSGRVVEPPPPS